MPRNTLDDLANILFEQIEKMNDDELEGEKLKEELAKLDAIDKASKQIINIANVKLQARKHMDEYGYTDNPKPIRMLEGIVNE